jgi:hypothetical protein
MKKSIQGCGMPARFDYCRRTKEDEPGFEARWYYGRKNFRN